MRLPDELDANARVMVRADGTDVRARRAINLTATGDATVTATDNPTTEAVDVTIDVTSPEPLTDHGDLTGLDDDDHTQYQLRSEKSVADGYASLDSTSLVPTVELGTGVASDTTFLRGDQTWATPEGGGGSAGAGRVIYFSGSIENIFQGETTWPSLYAAPYLTFTEAYAWDVDDVDPVEITEPQWGLSFDLDNGSDITATEIGVWGVELFLTMTTPSGGTTVGDVVDIVAQDNTGLSYQTAHYVLEQSRDGAEGEGEDWPDVTTCNTWSARFEDAYFRVHAEWYVNPSGTQATDLEDGGLTAAYTLTFTRLV